jgi:hypothetical protein
MQGVSTAFLEDVWSRNFLNLWVSGGVADAGRGGSRGELLLAAYFYGRVYRHRPHRTAGALQRRKAA